MSTPGFTPGFTQCSYSSPVGALRLVASPAGLCAVLWPTDNAAGAPPRVPLPPLADAITPVLDETSRQLDEYFAGQRQQFDLTLDLRGTPFQLAVWRALTTIPYGSTASYSDQARRLDRPKAVRAVGAANGRNPLSIVLPCHRVVGANGALTGFAGGLAAKRWLLNFELGIANL
jgi:methylated-DNA-[protein]-cysteine S-methyltransferase